MPKLFDCYLAFHSSNYNRDDYTLKTIPRYETSHIRHFVPPILEYHHDTTKYALLLGLAYFDKSKLSHSMYI